MGASRFALHDFVPAYLPEMTDLWIEAWKHTAPGIDFEARRPWFVERMSTLNEAGTNVICVLDSKIGAVAGFVTVNPASGYIDQLAVATRHWGKGLARTLLAEVKRRAPHRLELEVNQDNVRAVRFYERNGFRRRDAGINPNSCLKTWRYEWLAD